MYIPLCVGYTNTYHVLALSESQVACEWLVLRCTYETSRSLCKPWSNICYL